MAFHLRKLIHTKRFLLRGLACLYCFLVIVALYNGSSRVQYTMPMLVNFMNQISDDRCKVDMTKLGDRHVDFTLQANMSELEAMNPSVISGGFWQPSDCRPWQKVAIIVPYRNRYSHLKVLLHRLHPMLQQQKLYYRIFVIEQAGDQQFNRGKLLNIGVREALKVGEYDCFVFQDVDMLPESDKNLYYCDDQTRHLASAIDEMRYHVMYYNYAGGVVALNKNNFFKVNGYSNQYWGWGNEDDDFSARTMEAGLLLTRPPEHIGKYKMVRHPKSWRSDNGYDLFLTWKARWKTDGINTLDDSQYKVEKIEEHPLYTNILVDVGKPPKHPPIDDTMERVSLIWFLRFFFP